MNTPTKPAKLIMTLEITGLTAEEVTARLEKAHLLHTGMPPSVMPYEILAIQDVTPFQTKMLPGQTPCTPHELAQLQALVRDAARAAELVPADDLEIQPFQIDRVTHGACPHCGAETEIRIGHDTLAPAVARRASAGVTIRGAERIPGPLKALEECPNCGSAVLADPTIYAMPHIRW